MQFLTQHKSSFVASALYADMIKSHPSFLAALKTEFTNFKNGMAMSRNLPYWEPLPLIIFHTTYLTFLIYSLNRSHDKDEDDG